MEKHPKAWVARWGDGRLLSWATSTEAACKCTCPDPCKPTEVRLVPVDDHKEMMLAWNKCTGEQLRANIAGFTETTDDE